MTVCARYATFRYVACLGPRNVSIPAYPAPMDAPAGRITPPPFPVAPADVPANAVRALMRTMLRHGQPVDEDLARLLVAMVIAALRQAAEDPRPAR